MLLQKTHLHTVMNLDANGVTLALHNAGFPEDSVKTATFAGMTSGGTFIYNCTYFDTDTKTDEDCRVHVYFTNKGVMHADY